MSEIKPILNDENITKYLIERYKKEKFTITFEQLAKLAHDLWYEAIIFYAEKDPQVQISEEKLAYWVNHCFMSYDKLSEEQKNKDRKIVIDWLYKNKFLE